MKKTIIIMTLALIVVLGFFCFYHEEKSTLLQDNKALLIYNTDLRQYRQCLQDSLVCLQNMYDSIQDSIDRLERNYLNLLNDYDSLQQINKDKLAAFEHVSADSAYNKLQLLHPTSELLLFPFSSSQVKKLFITSMSLPLIQSELCLQKSLLNECKALTSGISLENDNLNRQVFVLAADRTLADFQVKNLNAQLISSTEEIRKMKNNNRLSKICLVGIGAAFTYCLISK